ncbi:O-antigen ligase family protein [Shewanella frigidimarina]|uniref:O-antigen ligase family protein n=1 Tax=Shewanella frigidimarina TaxID=56812 RepID=UPI001FE1C650|nr:O-antigen ligase family protein [Shewanella frigidimarina]
MSVQLKTYSRGLLIVSTCFFLLGTVFAVKFARLVGVESEYDIKRIILIGCVWLFSLGLCFVKDIEFIRFSTATKAFVGIFFTLAVCSALLSKHPFWSGIEIANIALLICAFIFFVISMRTFEKDIIYFWVYTSFLLFSVFTFVKYILFLLFSYADAQSFDIHGLISGYVNVRFFNQLQVMVIPLLFLPFFKQDLAKFRSVSFIVISLHWMVLLQTEARGGFLSLILASSMIMLFLGKASRRQFIFTLLRTILLGIFLWLVFIIAIPYWLMESANFQFRTTSSGRLDLWLFVLKNIPENLLLGFGPMSFTWAEGKPLPNAHPHNAIIQLLYEYGIITCLVTSSWVITRIYSRLRMLKLAGNSSGISIVCAVLSGLIYSLFSGVAVMPFAQILFIFLLSMMMQYGGNDVYKLGILTRIGLFLLISAISCLLLATYQYQELLPGMFPRIWVHGLISY